MPTKAFEKFINELSSDAHEAPVDWEACRDKWLNDLADLYKQLESYLHDYEKDNKIHITYNNRPISEEGVGEYIAKEAAISVVSRMVRVEPIGCNIIGARGRVDVHGPGPRFSTVPLLLVREEATSPGSLIRRGSYVEPPGADGAKYVWKIATRPPDIKYVTLDEEAFLDALMELVGD